jgi:hypothetical protein
MKYRGGPRGLARRHPGLRYTDSMYLMDILYISAVRARLVLRLVEPYSALIGLDFFVHGSATLIERDTLRQVEKVRLNIFIVET